MKKQNNYANDEQNETSVKREGYKSHNHTVNGGHRYMD